MRKLGVLVVDDHHVVRLGLVALLETEEDLTVVGQAGTAEEAVREAERLHPDIVILDIRLPGDGITACKQIKEKLPDTRVVILTSYADDDLVLDAFLAGAEGYVLKQLQGDTLVETIRAVMRGDAVLDPPLMRRLVARVRKAEAVSEEIAFQELSSREREILFLLSEGLTNSEIGERLNLSEKTVGNHVGNILSKLELSNRVQAATFAVRHNIQRYVRAGL